MSATYFSAVHHEHDCVGMIELRARLEHLEMRLFGTDSFNAGAEGYAGMWEAKAKELEAKLARTVVCTTCAASWADTASALVCAERDALKKRVEELEAIEWELPTSHYGTGDPERKPHRVTWLGNEYVPFDRLTRAKELQAGAEAQAAHFLAQRGELEKRVDELKTRAEQAEADVAACIGFCNAELDFEFFRAELLYTAEDPKRSHSEDNAKKLQQFLGRENKGAAILEALGQERHGAKLLRQALVALVDEVRSLRHGEVWRDNAELAQKVDIALSSTAGFSDD